jgi:hypothetical protein
MSKTITINTATDRILARMQVREEAHSLNFNRIDQARISLAAYNVISGMDMGITCDGEVFVEPIQDGDRTGMQVVCTTWNKNNDNFTASSFSDSSLLVDELTVEKIIPNGERVILVIWARPFYE